jgi:hypothetical protein
MVRLTADRVYCISLLKQSVLDGGPRGANETAKNSDETERGSKDFWIHLNGGGFFTN